MTRRRASLAIIVGATTWGTTGTSQALADVAVAPAAVGAARLVVGTLVLVALAAVVRRDGPGIDVLPRGPLVVAGVAATAYQVAFFTAVDRVGVALGTLVAIGSAPMLTGIVAWAVDRVVPGRAWLTATALAVAGSVLVLAPGGTKADGVGLAAALAAGLAYAVLTVASRRLLTTGVSPAQVMAAVFGVAAVPALGVLAVTADGWQGTGREVALVLWLGVVTLALGFALYAVGLRVLDAPTVGTLTLTEPLVATLLGVVLLGERLGAAAGAGVALLVLGLAVLARDQQRRSVPGHPAAER